MEELINLYEKFCSHEYDIADVSRILSYIGVPDDISIQVEQAEERIEYIRFMVSDNEQYEMVKSILYDIISYKI